jgi:predicted nucleic-acid-binding Zn-ribbon protein
VTELPPFSGDDPTCPKCKNNGAATRYLAVGYCNHASDLIIGVHANERLHRECNRCSYAWDEAIVEQEEPHDGD